MKNIISLIIFVLFVIICKSQTYNASLFTTSNKPYGSAQFFATDARTMFFDVPNQVFRAYKDTAEVKSYLNLAKYRSGAIDILVNTGGTLNSGVITGGSNSIWCFLNGTADSNLVRKIPDATGGPNVNIGIGYRLAVPNTNNIKTLNPGYGILNDSTTAANTITQTLDTATVFPAVRATILTDRIYPESFGAVGDGVTDDAAAFQNMYDWVAAQPYRTFIIAHSHRVYLINDTVFLPKTITGASADLRRIKIEGSGVTYLKTNTGPMFYRKPNDATEAGSIISYYTLTIDGLTIKGNSTAGQVGLDIAALYTPVITGCSFVTLDTAVLAKFWLNGRIENNFFTLNKSIGFKGSSGEYYWSGATTTNSAFNIDLFSGNRIFNQVNSYAGLMFLAADGVIVRDHISEGSNPRYDIYNDSQAGGVDGMRFENIWFESTGGSALNTCFYFRNGGITYINGLQNGYADTLFKFENTLNSSHFVVENIGFYPPTGKIFDAGGVSLGASVTMSVGNMYKTYADMLVDTARWVGGVVGPQTTVLSDGQLKSVSTNISLKPNMYASKISRSVVLEGTLLSPVDDGDAGNYGIGGYFNVAANRPHIGWFGTGGLWVDATSKYGFGTASNGSDYLSRPSAGRYSFNGTGQLRIPSGTTAQRLSGASGDIRANSDTVAIEYWDATAGAFKSLASRDWVRSNYSAYTFTSGLTNASGTVTNDLITGVSGGQTAIGGTGSGDNLTLSSTSNGTKGKVLFGASSAYDEVNVRLGLGNTAPTTTLDVTGAATVSGNIGYGSIGGTGTNFYTASQTNAATTVVTSQYMFGGITSLSMRVGMRGQNSTTIPNNNGYASFVIGEQTATEGTSGTHAFFGQAVIKPLNVTAGSAAVTRAATLLITNASNITTSSGINDALLVDTGYAGFGTGTYLRGGGSHDFYNLLNSNKWSISRAPKDRSFSEPALQIDTFKNVYVGGTFLSSFPTQSTGGNFYVGSSSNTMLGGGVFENYFIATSNATLTETLHNIYVDATSGNVTITLPAVSAVVSNTGAGLGIVYNIKRIDASGNTVTITRSGSDLIDGATSFTLASMEAKTIQAVGASSWYIQ